MLERSDIIWPMWRKKVDRSLLFYGITPLPAWVCSMWSIEPLFSEVFSKKDPESRIKVEVVGNKLVAQASILRLKTPGNPYRLDFGKQIKEWLCEQYKTSFITEIELSLREANSYSLPNATNLRQWEFIDMEYNCSLKEMKIAAHYRHDCDYPEIASHLIANINVSELKLKVD